MANREHLKTLKQGVDVWNQWRREHPTIKPFLYDTDLSYKDLRNANLSDADFSNTILTGAIFRGSKLDRTNFTGAQLYQADLSDANLSSADLSAAQLGKARFNCALLGSATLDHARLVDADFSSADLSSANLIKADLSGATLNSANISRANLRDAILISASLQRTNLHLANLRGTNLLGASLIDADLSNSTLNDASIQDAELGNTNFDRARMFRTIIADVDLRGVNGLETVNHQGPSEISFSTIYRSEGQISEIFLRGCGLPEELITHIPSLVAAIKPVQFYSCFISYSSKDEQFARRLHERMRAAGLRVWFAPEDIKGGEKLYEQIDRAIQVHDRLLLVLSESSLQSEWVMTEIRRARKAEVKENRRKLFPIRLTDYGFLKEWECFDADHGKDLAVEVREYFIPDFSNWKSHDDFEKAFARLLSDLKAST